MAIFRPLATRSPQRPPGPAWRNKVLADSADDPDDADKPDDLNESNKSDDSDDSLMTSSASYPNCKKWSWPRFPRPAQWPKTGQFFLKAFCKMAIFQHHGGQNPQRPPGQTWRNKILADSANDPDDADKPDDLDESDNYDDSDDSLVTSRASYPNCKKSSWPRFPRPGQWPKSDQFLLTAYCKMTIIRPLAARSLQKPPGRA